MILTIEDFRNATDKEVKQVLQHVTVTDDLNKFNAWLNSAEGYQAQGTFELGFNGKRGLGLHPSAICKKGTCPLKHYLDCTGEVVSDEVFHWLETTQLIFDAGTALHAVLQLLLKEMYEDQFEPEISLVDEDLLINSHTDGRIMAPWYRFLIEIKTIKSTEGGSSGFEAAQRRPQTDHVRQLTIYMYVDDCPFGLLLYFGKNTSDMKEHPLVWNQELWEEIYEEIEPIIEAVKIGEPPTPKVGSHCRDCGYLHGCKFGKDHVSGIRGRRRAIQGTSVR